jgi:molybdenum cofactor cytidylyltransferase
MFSELVMLKGDEGARRLLARYPTAPVELDDPGVLIDIDTVADLAAARRRISEAPPIPTP